MVTTPGGLGGAGERAGLRSALRHVKRRVRVSQETLRRLDQCSSKLGSAREVKSGLSTPRQLGSRILYSLESPDVAEVEEGDGPPRGRMRAEARLVVPGPQRRSVYQ